MAWFVRNIWHRYHSRYFKIVSNFTHLTTHEIPYNNFEISLVVFIPNIVTNHAITYTNDRQFCNRMILDGEEFRRNSNREWFWPQIETLFFFSFFIFWQNRPWRNIWRCSRWNENKDLYIRETAFLVSGYPLAKKFRHSLF